MNVTSNPRVENDALKPKFSDGFDDFEIDYDEIEEATEGFHA